MITILHASCVNAQQKAKQTTLINIFSEGKVEGHIRNFFYDYSESR